MGNDKKKFMEMISDEAVQKVAAEVFMRSDIKIGYAKTPSEAEVEEVKRQILRDIQEAE